MAPAKGFKVAIPEPGSDRPELGRVGIIAAAGFVIGVAWPWLSGVRLVPAPPNDEVAEAVAPAPSGAASGAVAATVAPSAPGAATEAPAAPTSEQSVKVSDLKITTCRDGSKKVKECDKVPFDPVARGRLGALARCDAATGASEMLSIGFDLDFEKKSVVDVFAGKSTTFSKEKANAIVECAKKEFANVSLEGLDHEHTRYTAFYFVEFLPAGTPAQVAGTTTPEETQAASGLATIAWDVAVVRDAPEDGKIATRLRYGTRVVVTGRRGKWYEIRYDAKGQKGWVHRNALGL